MRELDLERWLAAEMARRLSRTDDPRPSRLPIPVASLPSVPAWSEQLRDLLLRALRAGIPRRLAAELRGVSTYVARGGAARAVTTADPELWEPLRFRITRAGIDACWARLRDDAVDLREATLWDRLLVLVLDLRALPDACEQLSSATDADWPAAAAIIRIASRHGRPDQLVWRSVFDRPTSTPLPLRTIAIQAAAEYLDATASLLDTTYSRALRSDGTLTLAPSPVGEQLYGADVFDPRHPGYLVWREAAPRGYGLDALAEAVRVWSGPASVAYDDADVITSLAQRVRLHQHRGRIRAVLARAGDDLGPMAASAGPPGVRGRSSLRADTREDPQ